ncbi:MAG: thioredoxin family protein, partial [Candidatus Izimaplasma sp.]|nr:thioredoxin family protein [Candidatus Izimaplasma bacterium]
TDIVEIANSGLMRTPGLIVNNRIILSGDVSNIEEIKAIISKTENKNRSEMNK